MNTLDGMGVQGSGSYASWLGPASQRIAAGYAAQPLPVIVEAVLAELTAAGRSFTAYDVTMVLRALFPRGVREVPHYGMHGVPGVQPEVHRQMAGYLGGGYTMRLVRPNGVDPARLYLPARRRPALKWWVNITARAGVSADTPTPLPIHAWVIRDGDG